MSEQDPNKPRRKLVKGYYVESRHMQAAGASRSREKSPNATMAKGRPIQKQQSSTPAIQGRNVLPEIEASSISIVDASGFLRLPKESSKNVGMNKTIGINKTSRRAGPTKTKENTLSVNEFNILYAQYLQAKFLESSALTALEKRSENAMEKIYLVWTYMQKLMDQNAALERNLSTVNHLIRLHKHLNKQEKMLLPILDIIPKLESQYEDIAKAVNIVQHKLEVKDMPLPKDKASEDEVIGLLSKISDLIQSLKSVHNSEEVIACAAVSEKFSQQGKLIREEIKRADELLTEANLLLVDETSLKLASEDAA